MILERRTSSAPSFGYSRAVRVAWRLIWPPAVMSSGALSLLSHAPQYRGYSLALLFISGAAASFATVGRIVTKPYDGFRITVVTDDGMAHRLVNLKERASLWIYVYSRQIVA